MVRYVFCKEIMVAIWKMNWVQGQNETVKPGKQE